MTEEQRKSMTNAYQSGARCSHERSEKCVLADALKGVHIGKATR